TVAAAIPAARVGVDNSLSAWFVEGSPERRAYGAFLDRFGNDEVIVVAFPEGSRDVDHARRALEDVDGLSAVVVFAGRGQALVARMESAPYVEAHRARILADVEA